MVAKLSASPWLSSNPGKRWADLFFFYYSFTWIFWCLCILVPFRLYDELDEWGYLAIGLVAALPCFFLPFYFQSADERQRPFFDRYWVKANVWIAIFSFVGNYLWTHYFFSLLGASYTFPSHDLNNVPITLYFMTHAYFCFYHALSNMIIRRLRHSLRKYGRNAQNGAEAVVVFLLAYATAYGETLTIAHFPYYKFTDRTIMYRHGALFYAIYFFVSFPVFFRLDERRTRKDHFTIWRVIMESLGSAMLVTLLLDFWRLWVGNLVPDPSNNSLVWN